MATSNDELADINGIKPLVTLMDGEEREVNSASSDSKYKVKRTFDHFYCTCPAWRNQGGVPVNARTCKHLRSLFSDAYENARLKLKNPHGPVPGTSKAVPKGVKRKTGAATKPASGSSTTARSGPQKRSKRKRDDHDEDEDEDNGDSTSNLGSKRARGSKASKPSSIGGKGNPAGDEADGGVDDGVDDGQADNDTTKAPQLLLANKWDFIKGADPTGWWISEKLDGVRTYYDGNQMISRLGNPFTPPQWLLDKLPSDLTLDGELFGGRGQFQSTVSVVKTINSPHWSTITFQLFDIPSMADKPFEVRYATLCKLFGPNGKYACKEIDVVKQELSLGAEHVLGKLKEVEQAGGEGLMLREPGSRYEGGRSRTLLKVKTFYDAEAIVTGRTAGAGKHKGATGALLCQMESGKKFSCGSGLSDKQRKNPPKVGTIIVYRFQELTRDGVPRFPVFVGEAIDKTEPKDAVVRPQAVPSADAKNDAQDEE